MMQTPDLTNREIYRLVGEAYAATYLDKAWMKTQAKRYINPLGKFRWMFKNIPRFIKTVILTGMDMLHSQGITGSIISEELRELMENGLPSDINIKKDKSEITSLITHTRPKALIKSY
jgi:hypothetical protein